MKLCQTVLLLILLTGCTVSSVPVKVHFCAVEDCTSVLVKELLNGRESIYFMAYSFTDKSIADALIKQSGYITVQGVIEKQRISQPYNKFNYMREQGVNVITDKNPATMHHKVFIIDEKTIVTGSFNPTKSANEANDENMVIIRDKDIALEYLTEFNRVIS